MLNASLPYADLPARWGVSCERGEGWARVAIEPVLGWRVMVAQCKKAVIWLVALWAWMILPWAMRRELLPFVIITAVTGTLILCFVVVAFARLRRRTSIELDPERLTITLQ